MTAKKNATRRPKQRTYRRFNRVTRAGKLALRAYHEAAHAVVFEAFGFAVQGLSLERIGESLARTEVDELISDDQFFASWVTAGRIGDALICTQFYMLALLAGAVAESICRDEPFDFGRFERETCWIRGQPVAADRLPPGFLQHNDRDKAHLMAARIVRVRPALTTAVRDHLARSCEFVRAMLTNPSVWTAVERVANALVRTDYLDGGDVLDVLDSLDGYFALSRAAIKQVTRWVQGDGVRKLWDDVDPFALEPLENSATSGT